jgi:SAM-dependent methyltransferase
VRDRLRAAVPAALNLDDALRDANRHFYDSLWTDAQLIDPTRFNTWPLVHSLLPGSRRSLEVAPGLRPRLPIEGTHFVDFSAPALARLRARGARAALGLVTSLPFPDARFDFVCALDIVEHVGDDERALAELTRVAAPGGALLLSAPLHPSRWTAFDDLVGHHCRYEPEALVAKLARHGLTVEQSAAYGMQPKSSRLVDFGMWWIEHHRERAMWWYNHVIMPLAVRFEKPLALAPGMIATEEVDEILLVCRRKPLS